MESHRFIQLAQPADIPNAPIAVVMVNYLLMKLGGQIEVPQADLSLLAHDYAGFILSYSTEKDTFLLTMKTRADEYPPPELANTGA